MAADKVRLLYGRNDACEQFIVFDTITANGATTVTSLYTFPRPFIAIPKIIGTAAVTGKMVSVTVSAITATAININLTALSGNTDAIPCYVTLEGLY